MGDIRIGYFLEDIAQEAFLATLVARIAGEAGLRADQLRHESRNAAGGKGRALGELRQFLRDVRDEIERPFALLIVAIDSNCQTFAEKRSEIMQVVQQAGYPGPVVCAIPDPHIERWYLADAKGLAEVIGPRTEPRMPRYKCERALYKLALRQAFVQTGVEPSLGGAEYGGAVARVVDLYAVGKEDAGFKHFLDHLREALLALSREGG